jgi:hypothetical protein
MSPSQNEFLAAEFLRLQKVRDEGRNAHVLMQLISQQHMAAGDAMVGSSSSLPTTFSSGVNLPSVPLLSTNNALYDLQRAKNFMLSQPLDALGMNMNGVERMTHQNSDTRTRQPPMPMNNYTNSLALTAANDPGFARSNTQYEKVDLSNSNRFQDSFPPMMNNQFVPHSFVGNYEVSRFNPINYSLKSMISYRRIISFQWHHHSHK